nr:serine hydrolase [uncultured Schaedlerella sp.]
MYAQIWREGTRTAEYKRMPVKTRLNTWSACKGVVSCAAGIALDEGLIRLDEKLVDIFPESVPEDPGSNLPKVSLEHLLTMTSGLENSLFFCDWEERYTTQQAVDSVCCVELP